jgi:hypothetical protein
MQGKKRKSQPAKKANPFFTTEHSKKTYNTSDDLTPRLTVLTEMCFPITSPFSYLGKEQKQVLFYLFN